MKLPHFPKQMLQETKTKPRGGSAVVLQTKYEDLFNKPLSYIQESKKNEFVSNKIRGLSSFNTTEGVKNYFLCGLPQAHLEAIIDESLYV
jgi:hypothetical protein